MKQLIAAVEDRPRVLTKVKMNDLFPGLSPDLEFGDEDTVDLVYSRPGPLTPKLNEHYVFPLQELTDTILVLEKPSRNNIYISGPSGTGKTEFARNLAAKFNVNLYEVDGSKFLTRAHLVGRHVVRGNEIHFQYGPIPLWLKNGGWLLINEYDTLDPDTVNVLKSVLEDDRRINLVENDEVIHGHPECRALVTANTFGRGDDTGMFVNTEVQSIADLRRFHAFIPIRYLDPEVEQSLVKDMFSRLTDVQAKDMVAIANQVREAYVANKMTRTMSTAEVVNWAENTLKFSSVHKAARISFLSSYELETATAVEELINAKFGQDDQMTLKDKVAAAAAAKKSSGA